MIKLLFYLICIVENINLLIYIEIFVVSVDLVEVVYYLKQVFNLLYDKSFARAEELVNFP